MKEGWQGDRGVGEVVVAPMQALAIEWEERRSFTAFSTTFKDPNRSRREGGDDFDLWLKRREDCNVEGWQ